MSRRTDADFVNDIQEAIQHVRTYIAGMKYEAFVADKKTQDAVIRNIEIIGEATKHISEQTRKINTKIPWKQMAGVRDRLIHHYFGVNIDIVWQIAEFELPSVLSMLERMLPDDPDD